MKQFLVFAFLLIAVTTTSFAQIESATADKEAAYTKTINERAAKIVAALGITESEKAKKVQAIIGGQYRNLNSIHTDRDTQIKTIKAKGETKEITEAAVKVAEAEATAKLNKLHATYLAQLSSQLTPEQVIKVKDGMTYNVAPNTYTSYLDMIPTLNAEQKKQILVWLTEAREFAMDAESSEKKHGWFGKYKGRINNYLSAAGYDLKKEGEAWQKRLKEKEEKKNTTKN